jgi:siroheme synthase-like protein
VDYFPIFVDLKQKKCLVIGGGEIACRKVEDLSAAQARVTVIAREVLPALAQMAPAVTIVQRPFEERDISRAYLLIIAATDDQAVNQAVAAAAAREGVLCNVVDQPALCSFIVPAVLQRGRIITAVSTAGSSPAFAAKVRDQIAATIGEEYGVISEFLPGLRAQVKQRYPDLRERQRFWGSFFATDLVALVKEHGVEGLEQRAREIIG